jgi:5-oxopent-3-ene-1,2,5-tricarboxylate decarboxylase / 2-hydroxyhepta-2,4-diene-1,7-dioate isomerase
MITGSIYGVVLNDQPEREQRAAAFDQPPYARPPAAPVLYVKPRVCVTSNGTPVQLAADARTVEAAATIGLLLGRDACRENIATALSAVAAMCLAIDLSVPNDSYYRPPVRHRARDGFLPVGNFAQFHPAVFAQDIVMVIDSVETHRWSCARLVRDAATLIADISAFMTLRAGDLLLVGLPGDAPLARAGQRIEARCAGLPAVAVELVAAEQA